jgi:hypothetical protein
MKKLGIALLVIVLLLCAGVAGAGWYAYSKVKSGDLSFLSMFNKGANTDLGITYSEQDAPLFLQSIQTEAKSVATTSPECQAFACISGLPTYKGSQQVTTTLTNAQGTALINEWIKLAPNAPFTAAQMRVNQDGSVDFAGTVSMAQLRKFGTATGIPADTMSIINKYLGSLGETFPVRASGTLTILNNNVDVNFSSFSVGVLPVPATLLSQYKSEESDFLEDRLATVQGLSITELSFADGKTTFKGTVPKTIYFVQ